MGVRYSVEYDLPGHQVLFDYGSRTDHQPVYKGLAKNGVAQSSPQWRIFKFDYNAAEDCVSKTSAEGAWTNRTGLLP